MSLSRRNKLKRPSIVLSTFYAKRIEAPFWWLGGLYNFDVYVSKKAKKQRDNQRI